ncbi:MAG: NfeD family protein [Nocardioides sp.]
MAFLDWLREHDWQAWLALSIVLGMAEMFSLDLILIMLAAGAVVGMVAALAGLGAGLQVIAAAGAAIAMLALVRPSVAARLHAGPSLEVGHGKLVGQQGVVTEAGTALQPGRIRLAGEIWSAAPYDDRLTLEPGQAVEVLEIRGATAYVHPIPSLEP